MSADVAERPPPVVGSVVAGTVVPDPKPATRFPRLPKRTASRALGRALFLVLLIVGLPLCAWTYRRVTTPICCNPNWLSAIVTLRNVSSSQTQLIASGKIPHASGTGGLPGTLGELSGGTPLRGTSTSLDPPVLSGAFRYADGRSIVNRSGYRFRVFLISPAGGASVDPEFQAIDDSSTRWCCYAWPATYGKSGDRTFFIDESGNILATDNPTYTGTTGPSIDAAFATGGAGRFGTLGKLGPAPFVGQDGGMWSQVN